jgi:hypothetical protein
VKQQINTRLSARTLSQIEYLAKHWEVSNTAVIARSVDEAYRQELVVNLYEDNAGRLFVGTDTGPWWDVSGMPDNGFYGDAMAIVAGETDNWTVEKLDAEPDADIVAYYEGTTLHVDMQSYEPKAKIAACKYMGFVLPTPSKGAPIHW